MKKTYEFEWTGRNENRLLFQNNTLIEETVK